MVKEEEGAVDPALAEKRDTEVFMKFKDRFMSYQQSDDAKNQNKLDMPNSQSLTIRSVKKTKDQLTGSKKVERAPYRIDQESKEFMASP